MLQCRAKVGAASSSLFLPSAVGLPRLPRPRRWWPFQGVAAHGAIQRPWICGRQSRQLWTGVTRPRLERLLQSLSAEALKAKIPKAEHLVDSLQELTDWEATKKTLEEEQKAEADAELIAMYDAEIAPLQRKIAVGSMALELLLLDAARDADSSAGDLDSRDIVLEVSPGVGGQEAALFAAEVWDMYLRFAARQGWEVTLQRYEEATGGGLQVASAKICGHPDEDGFGPHGWFCSESGVHRVQRIPVTDKRGRMQTSGATVVVLPVAEEADVSLSPGDLKVEVSKKSSGPGGQSVNASHQAIRATHLPSGMTVHVASSQSQFENRTLAIELLRTRLLARQNAERAEFERKERKQQRGTGDRSEKIRTYNFQRGEVVDHVIAAEGKAAGVSLASIGTEEVVFEDGLEEILKAHKALAKHEKLEVALDWIEEQVQQLGPR